MKNAAENLRSKMTTNSTEKMAAEQQKIGAVAVDCGEYMRKKKR